MNMELIASKLGEAIGLDPASLGPTVISRALKRRAAATGSQDLADYDRKLAASPDELQALIEEIVVNESWFLRHPQAFEVLLEHARATLAARPNGVYRVASVPSASGEEPYSIAMTLIAGGIAPERFSIDAADVSLQAIQRARVGVYSARALREVPADWRSRFFTRREAAYEVLPLVKNCVRLAQENLLDPAPLSLKGPYDAVFCRNLLIYLTAEARARLLARLEQIIGEKGLIFLGHAERLEGVEQRFERLDRNAAFAFRRRAAAPQLQLMAPVGSPVPKAPPKPGATRQRAAADRPAPPRAHAAAVAAASKPIDQLEQAQELANRREYEEALALCRSVIEKNGPSARAYHVIGMIQQASGKLDLARAAFERAIYLNPRDEETLLALSLIAQRQADTAGASRYAARARKASKGAS